MFYKSIIKELPSRITLPRPGEGKLILTMEEALYISDLYLAWKPLFDQNKRSAAAVTMPGLYPKIPVSLSKKGLVIAPQQSFRIHDKDPQHLVHISYDMEDYFRVWRAKEEFSSMREIELLTREYQAWLRDQYLPNVSADELIHHKLTPYQRQYVSHFILRWDAAEAKDLNETP